jgi:hypothetical protein
MIGIEDIHFQYEQLTTDQQKAFESMADPLHDNTDFLFDPPSKYIKNILEKYKGFHPQDPKNSANGAAYAYQYAMSAAYLHKKYGKKITRFENQTVAQQLDSTDALSLRVEDLGPQMFDVYYVETGAKQVGSVVGFFVIIRGDAIDLQVLTKGEGNNNVGYGSYQLHLGEGTLLSDVADKAVLEAKEWSKKTGLNSIDEKAVSEMRKQINFIFSTLFYIHSAVSNPDRIIETVPAKKKASTNQTNAKKESIRQAKTFHSILIKTLPHEQREFSEGAKKREGGMPLTLVRGHYRRQPIGSRAAQSYKTIWIKPFWRGDEDMADTTHVYKV